MIRITSIKRCHVADYDDIYLIIRSTDSLKKSKSSILQRSTHVPALAPSKELFYKYLNLERDGSWNENSFNTIFKPMFEKEIKNNAAAESWFEKIINDDNNGRKIALLTYTANEKLCHRSIIGEILRDRGCNVIFDKDTKRGCN